MQGTEGSEFCSAVSNSWGVRKKTTIAGHGAWGKEARGLRNLQKQGSESPVVFDMVLSCSAPGKKGLTPAVMMRPKGWCCLAIVRVLSSSSLSLISTPQTMVVVMLSAKHLALLKGRSIPEAFGETIETREWEGKLGRLFGGPLTKDK